MIYFDNAATTFPKPTAVYRGCEKAMYKFGANPGRSGHIFSMETAEMVFSAREAVAEFFNAGDIENVVFTQNCTMSINMVLKGLLKKGDHVVISNLEHNAVARPIYRLHSDGIISYSVANVEEGKEEKTVSNFKNAIRPNTKLVVCTHASNVFGIKLPIRDIGALCKSRGVLFMVDAAQTAGIVPIDIKREGIDFLCVAPHKGLYAPMGTGVLVAEKSKVLKTIIEGGTGSASSELLQPETIPDKFESGTVNVVGIAGILYGINTIKRIGINAISSHEFGIVKSVYRRLKTNSRIELYTDFPDERYHVPVLSFNVKGMDSADVTSLLSEKGFALRGGLHCAPLAHIAKGTEKTGTVRLCPSMFTTISDSNKLCDAIFSVSAGKN